MYTHLELSSQRKLIHLKKKRPTILDGQNLVCENRASGGIVQVCLWMRVCVRVCVAVWGLTSNVDADDHMPTLDLLMSSAQS